MGTRHFVIHFAICALCVTALDSNVWAVTVGHQDRARSLYQVVVSLDGQGNPVLPVSVYKGAKRVQLRAKGGLRVLSTGGGTVSVSLPGPEGVMVTASEHTDGQRDHWVAVARAPANDMMSLRREVQRWKSFGHKVVPRGVGATYGLKGRVLDTRRTVLCLDQPFAEMRSARIKAASLAAKYSRQVFVHVELASPPAGKLTADARAGVTVQADDVMWFEAIEGTLEVTSWGRKGKQSMLLPGRVYVTVGAKGTMVVVNEARIETLLEGVVAAEIFASAPRAALRAQAVAARTDLLAKVGLRHRTDPFSICSDVHCQAYKGAKRLPAKIIEAVKSTRGQVLTGADGRLVDTFYHAVSGGHTENNENAWRMRTHPNLRGVSDLRPGVPNPLANGATQAAVKALLDSPDRSYAAASGRNKRALRWTVKRTPKEIRKHLQKVGVTRPLTGVQVLKRGVSGRAIEIELTQLGGSSIRLWGELRIRRAFRALKSSLFLVTPGPKDRKGVPRWWQFRGAGYGHGVGLDQTGAYGRAKLGQKYREILSAYYRGARLEQLY